MDRIIIRDLEVYAYHGVHKEEKELGQMFLVSVEISLDLSPAAKTDDLSKTVHYGHVCKDIEHVMSFLSYDLIETIAYNIIRTLLEKYPSVESVRACVKKPWAPMGKHLKHVAVEMELNRRQLHG